jgi:hypothetical protein
VRVTAVRSRLDRCRGRRGASAGVAESAGAADRRASGGAIEGRPLRPTASLEHHRHRGPPGRALDMATGDGIQKLLSAETAASQIVAEARKVRAPPAWQPAAARPGKTACRKGAACVARQLGLRTQHTQDGGQSTPRALSSAARPFRGCAWALNAASAYPHPPSGPPGQAGAAAAGQGGGGAGNRGVPRGAGGRLPEEAG